MKEFAAEYQAAHRRAVKLWGPAKLHPCAMCPGQAAQWAYDRCDPSSRENYSDWPEFYMPLCRNCHVKYDGPNGGARQAIKRVRRYTPRDCFVPYVPPVPVPKVKVPTSPKTEAEWDLYLATR